MHHLSKKLFLVALIFCLCGIKSIENYFYLFQIPQKCTACKEC